MKKQITVFIIIAAVIIGIVVGGFYGYQALNKNDSPTPFLAATCNTTNNGKSITYKGEDGVSALDLLKKNCTAESQGQGESAFITKINGVEADTNKEFWSFKINGEMSSVGAGSYTTKNSDTITWELSSF